MLFWILAHLILLILSVATLILCLPEILILSNATLNIGRTLRIGPPGVLILSVLTLRIYANSDKMKRVIFDKKWLTIGLSMRSFLKYTIILEPWWASAFSIWFSKMITAESSDFFTLDVMVFTNVSSVRLVWWHNLFNQWFSNNSRL